MRVTMLPERLVNPLRSHLTRVRALHERDLAKGFGEVHMPFALARKYPKAGRIWIWQYVFRATRAKRGNRFVSFTALIAMASIALRV